MARGKSSACLQQAWPARLWVGRWVRCLPNSWVELDLPMSTAPNPVPRLQELDTKHHCCHLGSLRLTEPQQLRASLGRLKVAKLHYDPAWDRYPGQISQPPWQAVCQLPTWVAWKPGLQDALVHEYLPGVKEKCSHSICPIVTWWWPRRWLVASMIVTTMLPSFHFSLAHQLYTNPTLIISFQQN